MLVIVTPLRHCCHPLRCSGIVPQAHLVLVSLLSSSTRRHRAIAAQEAPAP
jgi:hypothetical protein